MNSATPPAQPLRVLQNGDTLVEAGQRAPIWRVLSGVLRMERPSLDGRMLVQLALPGDLIGLEVLCDQPQAYSATALIPAQVQAVEIMGARAQRTTMARGLLQQQRQTLDMVRLRSGPIQLRVAYLLTVLGKDMEGRTRTVQRNELPTLREMAQIVDATAETVCRELTALMPKPKGQNDRKAEPVAKGRRESVGETTIRPAFNHSRWEPSAYPSGLEMAA